MHIFAGFYGLGHLLHVPKPAGLRSQFDHRINNRIASSGHKRHGNGLARQNLGDANLLFVFDRRRPLQHGLDFD